MMRRQILGIVLFGYQFIASAQQPSSLRTLTTPPFRVIFKAHHGSTFQINTLDKRQPSAFLKVGDFIPGTNLQVTKCKDLLPPPRFMADPIDLSELTITNPDTKKSLVLVCGKALDVSQILSNENCQ